MAPLNENLNQLNRDQFIEEIIKLRNGTREHRDSNGQALCWHHPKLWKLLPEKSDLKIEAPEWSEILKGCIHYLASLEDHK